MGICSSCSRPNSKRLGNISCPGVLNIGVFVGIFGGTLNGNNKGGFVVSFSFTTGIGLNVKSCFYLIQEL